MLAILTTVLIAIRITVTRTIMAESAWVTGVVGAIIRVATTVIAAAMVMAAVTGIEAATDIAAAMPAAAEATVMGRAAEDSPAVVAEDMPVPGAADLQDREVAALGEHEAAADSEADGAAVVAVKFRYSFGAMPRAFIFR
jgi:hypothetical protein